MTVVREDILIIGSGFAGLGLAARLKFAGRNDFTILEKSDALGGTWRDNRYPGAGCDVASALYSYSFAPKADWDHKWAKQAQILDYMETVARDYDLERHIRYGAQVNRAEWNGQVWQVTLADGSVLSARYLVSAIGQLHHPKTPHIQGQATFSGQAFHTAKWPSGYDLTGRDVGIVGNAASALQLIPEAAKVARTVTVYHRSPNWVAVKGDRPYWAFEHALKSRFPALGRLERGLVWAKGEYVVWPAIQGKALQSGLVRLMHRRALRKAFPDDPDMRARLTPNYPVGARRILLSDELFKALAQDNVDVVFEDIERISDRGVVAGGQERPHDTLIYATGFHTNPFLKEIEVIGEEARSLADHWQDGAEAYLGVATADFPNLFILYGPNTNTGHTSIIFKLEQQFALVLKLLDAAHGGSVSVDPVAEAQYNQEIQRRLRASVWDQVDASWYKDGDKITNNWPGSSREFARRLKRPNLDHFRFGA
ncbi:MAG: NAD(P)/FAD-dependent oxidoreductase [Pseudomonadota bacterium]